jgi:capsular polysaccharide biosynthesis protein
VPNDPKPSMQRRTTESLVEAILAAARPQKILCLADHLPKCLLAIETSIVLVGSKAPPATVAASSLDFRRVDNQQGLIRAIGAYWNRGELFDLVYVDHDHRIISLIYQIQAIAQVSHDSTIILFDDAVPPTIEMASDAPRQGWWVGSVWIVPHLVNSSQAPETTLCVDSSPTGLFVSLGRPSIDVSEAVNTAESVRAKSRTLESIKSELNLADESRITEFISKVRGEAINHRNFVVRPARDDEFRAHQIREISSEETMVRGIPNPFLDLSNRTIQHKFGVSEQTLIENQSLLGFRDALLIGTNSILVDDVLFCRYTKVALMDTERIAAKSGYGNEGTGLFKSDGAFMLPRTKLLDTTKLNGRFLLATPDERDNWGMWLLVTLPTVVFYLENKSDYDGIICFVDKPWQRRFLQVLGVDSADVVSHDITNSYAIDRLDVICRGSRNLCTTKFDRHCFKTVIEKLETEAAEPPGNSADEAYERVFISRLTSSRTGYRMLVEEAQLIEGLKDLGFVAIEPEKFSFAQQVKIFQRAKTIVGLGGAGMFNAVFAKPNTVVITIESTAGFVHAHANLFACSDLRFGVIFGCEDASDSRTVHRRWNIAVEPVIAAISNLIGYEHVPTEDAKAVQVYPL